MNESRLYRLVYVSRNMLPGDADVADTELAAILAASRRNNEPDGITGALLFNQDCFAQVLEGGLEAVQSTFERIQCDPRHQETVILSAGPVAQREFGQWSMAYAGRTDDPSMRFDRLTDVGSTPPGEGADQITDMLRHAVVRVALV